MMAASFVLNSLILIIFASTATAGKLPKSLGTDVKQSTRIIGGVPAKRGEFVGQVSLQNRFRRHVCGGTLIDETHIVTAAHCRQPENKIVYVMGDDVVVSKNGSDTRQLRVIKNFVVNPNYSEDTMDNDIAVVRVYAPFKFSANFSAIRRSTQTPKVGQKCTAVGWGTTVYAKPGEEPKSSIQLLKVDIEVLNTTDCNSANSYDGLLTSNMFCAGDKRGNYDACQGDSGGLLTCGNNTLTGVISFGLECGLPDYPGIYTDVSKYNKWINETIAKRELPPYEYALDSSSTIGPTTPSIPTTTPGTASIAVASMTILVLTKIFVHFLI